jgi:hypothetical protein
MPYSVMWLDEWIIHGDDVDIVVLNCIAEDNTSNTTEAIDSDLCGCHVSVLLEISPAMMTER